MLKRIDCVLIKVRDLQVAAERYSRALGLKELWRDGQQLGLGMSETDTEIVIHTDDSIPTKIDVNYLVDDVLAAVGQLTEEGFEILRSPFDIAIGKCAVVQDTEGVVWSLLDMTKGPRSATIQC